jgi:hypothetical protein
MRRRRACRLYGAALAALLAAASLAACGTHGSVQGGGGDNGGRARVRIGIPF